MTTAQNIMNRNSTASFADAQKLESELREISILVVSNNCYDRTWYFNDGSSITKTRDGYVVNF
ncbi:MAG TPA: hypothetical protein VFM18_14960 [Methanosarcina sp.]|nr:hypothetical protein [Methanosarcina sp.]